MTQQCQQVSRLVVTLLAVSTLNFSGAFAQQPNVATAKSGMVATVHPLATKAGVEAFQAGGNAVDAAISAAVMLGVVDGHNSGLGGGCFMLIHTADGKLIALDAREVAPAAATRDMYLRDGQAAPNLSQTGPLAVAVPGAVAGYSIFQKRFCKLKRDFPWIQAEQVARAGFPINAKYASAVTQEQEHLNQFPGSAAILLHEDKTPLQAGETLIQPDLATVCQGIAEQGPEYFYFGPVAKTVGDWMKTNGGIVTAQDFANYQVVEREPLVTTFRDYTIVGFPPPSSGGVHVAQILNILETFDMRGLHVKSPVDAEHVLAEAMKLAFADRAYWLGDPAYANVPKGLIDKTYARELAAKIDLNKATRVLSHGTPPDAKTQLFERHTTHIAAADAEGNWVAITQTVNTTFGSKVIVPGTGIILNNQMDDFSIQPGVPNAFGLIGAEANNVAPGKRPLSSMSPTIVLKDGKPVMTVGAAGGPKIITEVLQALFRHLEYGLSVPDAIAATRLHHQWSPDRLMIEKSASESLVKGLTAKGHEIQFLSYSGVTQAIGLTPDGQFIGVHDPRVEGQAAGVD